tara:strand:+ start:1605 stop:1976 length:372 start_codon:yes stop_codon:yes gene_type:complete
LIIKKVYDAATPIKKAIFNTVQAYSTSQKRVLDMNIQDKESKIRATVEALGWFPWLIDADNDLVIARRDCAPFEDRQYSTHRVLTAEFGRSGNVELHQFALVSGHYDLTMIQAMDSIAERRAN